ncbi:MAG: GxxExxY protein [Patescibacteria group bacterium]|nr:GxxExxY protein [Patescibacteria group bacterium]
MPKVIYPELSYKIVGIVYKVYNEIGPGYQEKYYQKAVGLEFKQQNIQFKEQLEIPLKYNKTEIGKFYLDFSIENKIILELKVGNKLFVRDYKQIMSYLKTSGLKLGLLVLFSKSGIQYRRILNIY